MDKPNFYSVLPASVRYDRRLSPLEKLLYAEISSLVNKEGFCFAGNAYFVELYGISERTVRRAIEKLVKFGFVSVEIESGNERKIYLAETKNDVDSEKQDNTQSNFCEEVISADNAEDKKRDGVEDKEKNKQTADKFDRADRDVPVGGQRCPALVDSAFKVVSRNNNINNKYNIYIAVLKFLNDTCKTAYRDCAKNKKHILARINEGYSLEDFKLVIKAREELWGKDPAMCIYLRPETLFGNKFSGYLEGARMALRVKTNKQTFAAEGGACEDKRTEEIINARLKFLEGKRQAAAGGDRPCFQTT